MSKCFYNYFFRNNSLTLCNRKGYN